MHILTVNVGSSSVRLSLFSSQGSTYELVKTHHTTNPSALLAEKALTQWTTFEQSPHAIIHRVVHGGQTLSSPCLLDASIESEIARLGSLAPLHHPRSLAWIAACRSTFPHAKQIAVFDTAFYRTLPKTAATYALPQTLCDTMGLRRFGFHGLAHQGMWEAWAQLPASPKKQARVISLQLGSGCSITAIKDGQAIDTSMGFTPLEGLVMATRAGDLDPGLLLHLLREGPYSLSQLETVLNEKSGLLGVSEVSADMRDLLASPEPAAKFAIDLFCYRVRKYIGAYLAVLQGADAILIGGGIGENSSRIREKILKPLRCFGVILAPKANTQISTKVRAISTPTSGIGVWVIPTQEDRLLLMQAKPLLPPQEGTH